MLKSMGNTRFKPLFQPVLLTACHCKTLKHPKAKILRLYQEKSVKKLSVFSLASSKDYTRFNGFFKINEGPRYIIIGVPTYTDVERPIFRCLITQIGAYKGVVDFLGLHNAMGTRGVIGDKWSMRILWGCAIGSAVALYMVAVERQKQNRDQMMAESLKAMESEGSGERV
ncbi:hypothetical protein V6Z11_D01G068500 [Gossypium hirsutum]